jgi:hypothetical protein
LGTQFQTRYPQVRKQPANDIEKQRFRCWFVLELKALNPDERFRPAHA